MNYLDLVQWPAMVMTLIAAWLIGSLNRHKRMIGFSCFLISNALWILWGVHADAHALVLLQLCLGVLNVRGVWKNELRDKWR